MNTIQKETMRDHSPREITPDTNEVFSGGKQNRAGTKCGASLKEEKTITEAAGKNHGTREKDYRLRKYSPSREEDFLESRQGKKNR